MTHAPRPLISHPSGALKGQVRVPGDKSISHRALLCSAMNVGKTSISGLLEGEDVLHTADALRQMGVTITESGGYWEVRGVGVGGLSEPSGVLDMGNSGTGARLLMGLVASHPFTSFFAGDASLHKRPMKRVADPLTQMGASILARSNLRLPLALTGRDDLLPIAYTLPVASAQVKSAILLAGLNTAGDTTVIEPERTRDHTEIMLRHFGAKISGEAVKEGWKVTLKGRPDFAHKTLELKVPADPSSAAFAIVAALITEQSELRVTDVCVNPLRIGLFTTLKEMGASLTFENEREECGEKVADILVRASALKGIRVPAERAPSMIDEYPILAVAAAFAKGETVMEGLAELRVKESDRFNAILAGLSVNGVQAKAEGDTLIVTGGKVKGGGKVATHMDHRIAMSFLVMGMAAQEPVRVDDGGMIRTSFPDFMGLMNSLGATIEDVEDLHYFALPPRATKAPPLMIA
ncbi:MAG: 3-phosphoshikimate 1-carboxyvinyltransferase, partial [Alphaproteobacteria bacterium]|nr:3-phosphoshikimate 1-carboxyvinyltransferase [Alphaproteobacteria bacterium]